MQSRAMIVHQNPGRRGHEALTGPHHLVNPVLFVDAGSGMRARSFKSSQCHVRCVCKINTISLSDPADSALLSQRHGGGSDGSSCRERGEAFEATFRSEGWGGGGVLFQQIYTRS